MATYLVGDVQGCYRSFKTLLKLIDYRSGRDTVWFLGDLVNRGPGSLDLMRWATDENAAAVLGNHDAYCLAAYAGVVSRKKDTLDELLRAPDCDSLMDWLRARPILHRIDRAVLVHAGVHPSWTLKTATKKARKIEERLRGDGWTKFLKRAFSDAWTQRRKTRDFNIFTRIRMVDQNDDPEYHFSGAPEDAPPELRAWFVQSAIARDGVKVYFGHWAALNHRRLPMAMSLDGGCVWGRRLFAHCLESDDTYSVPAHRRDLT